MNDQEHPVEVVARGERLVMRTRFPGWTRDGLYDAFADAKVLSRWWPEKADLDVRVGGKYHMEWPAMGWHLRGHYTDVEPGEKLGFTWKWDHEPDLPVRTVLLEFEREGDAVVLHVNHGPYGDTGREQEDLDSHVQGWGFFLARLQGLDPV